MVERKDGRDGEEKSCRAGVGDYTQKEGRLKAMLDIKRVNGDSG